MTPASKSAAFARDLDKPGDICAMRAQRALTERLNFDDLNTVLPKRKASLEPLPKRARARQRQSTHGLPI
jgi:hypothetical protein